MRNILRRLLTDVSGNFGLMTALIIVPLIGGVGMAIDFENALSLRTQIYAAADAAAIGAISETSTGVAAAMAMSGDGAVTAAQTDARSIFLGDISNSVQNITVTPDISVTKAANVLTSTVTFHADVPTTFLQILGKTSIPISGTATAQYQTATFMDFYMLLDNTPSMGVGATPADVALMVANTSDKCAFACHNLDTTNNYYNLAKQLGVTMRIDVVRQATQKLTATATANSVSADQYRMAVYDFGAKAEAAQLTSVSSLSSDMTAVSKATSAIDLMTTPSQNYNNDEQTGFDTALTQLKTTIGTGGGGTSSTDREKIIFLVTDGVGDSQKPYTCTEPLTGSRCQEPLDTSFCDPIKNQNIKIAILYTTYLPLPSNSWYVSWISPFQSQIGTRLQSCASPGLYFEVSPTQGIVDAMNALFLKIIRSPRVTS